MNFGEIMKKLREEKKISQRVLGEKLGVTQQTIAQYEKAVKPPKYETIEKIANALEVSPSVLQTQHSVVELFAGITKEFDQTLYENIEKQRLLTHYENLNKTGKKEAIKRVEELAEIPKYQKYFNSTAASLNAAHAVPEASEENKKHDEDIMNDDSQWS